MVVVVWTKLVFLVSFAITNLYSNVSCIAKNRENSNFAHTLRKPTTL